MIKGCACSHPPKCFIFWPELVANYALWFKVTDKSLWDWKGTLLMHTCKSHDREHQWADLVLA